MIREHTTSAGPRALAWVVLSGASCNGFEHTGFIESSLGQACDYAEGKTTTSDAMAIVVTRCDVFVVD